MKKPCLMYLIHRILFVVCFFLASSSYGQDGQRNFNELEIGVVAAGAEAAYYGAYSKVNYNFSDKSNYFYAGIGLTIYADFRGEIAEQSKLENDVDMRIIPNVYLGYNVSWNKFDFGIEMPIGTSIAITRGKLVNTRVGFEREYSNSEFLLHYGLGFSVKYQLPSDNKIGIYTFQPILKDGAWSPPTYGLSWTNLLDSN